MPRPNRSILLLMFICLKPTFASQSISSSCGKINLKLPLTLQNTTGSSSTPSSASHNLLCKSDKVYLITSLGLFQVSLIDYKAKHLTMSRPSSDGYEFKAKISFENVHRVAEICKDCNKPNETCSAAVRCICHAKQCKDKIINKSGKSWSATASIIFTVAIWMMRIAVRV